MFPPCFAALTDSKHSETDTSPQSSSTLLSNDGPNVACDAEGARKGGARLGLMGGGDAGAA